MTLNRKVAHVAHEERALSEAGRGWRGLTLAGGAQRNYPGAVYRVTLEWQAPTREGEAGP